MQNAFRGSGSAGMVKAFYVGYTRDENDHRFRARWFVEGDGHRVSRAAFRSADTAIKFGRRMAQALRWGVVHPDKIFV